MNCLPEGIEFLSKEKKYLKLSSLTDGDNKLRIVMRPIGGWLIWEDKKPLRFKPQDKPKAIGAEEKPKEFWALYVWDYQREDLFILEITQGGVIKSLRGFAQDPDIGDFTKYDIKIKKTGSGMQTRYEVFPIAPKPLAKPILEALAKAPIRLEALFEGGDPWTDLAGSSYEGEIEQVQEVEELDTLHMDLEDFAATLEAPELFQRFLEGIAESSNTAFEEIARRALKNRSNTTDAYNRWLSKQSLDCKKTG